jgi:hypothetical protein
VGLQDAASKVSPAAAFVMTATHYAGGGAILAIVPTSTLHSEKDSDFWEGLLSSWELATHEYLPRGSFPGLAAQTALISLVPRVGLASLTSDVPVAAPPPLVNVRIVRGNTAVNKTVHQVGGIPFLHTTGLRREGIVTTPIADSLGRRVRGDVVLLPRIGAPVPWKIKAVHVRHETILSDCVIGLECSSPEDSRGVASILQARWGTVRRAWSGSCAPYIGPQWARNHYVDHLPELPKPAEPRGVAVSASVMVTSTGDTGNTTSCAIRVPLSSV